MSASGLSGRGINVRFEAKADILAADSDVRVPPKADIVIA
jgi:hypothetical protein